MQGKHLRHVIVRKRTDKTFEILNLNDDTDQL